MKKLLSILLTLMLLCGVSASALAADEPLRIAPDFYVILDIHNDHSEDKDYVKYVIVSKEGTKYVTGSESFFSSFKAIVDEMGGTGEEYEVEVYRLPSKNYKGKEFLTCSIV